MINYTAPKRALAVARGHPYDREAFASLFEELEEFDVCQVEQPVASRLLNAATAGEFDVAVCYDMPGVDFVSEPGKARCVGPAEEFRQNFLAMLEAGIGMVFMHHSLAAWPAWPVYADIVGGRFHYRQAELRGEQWPDSGYRHEVEHTLTVQVEHPVTEGLPDRFTMTDELYLCPVFDGEVIPLLRSDYSFEQDNFYSAARAVAGEMYSSEGWSHPPGSNCVAWCKAYAASPIVYIQGGDDARALRDPNFRQLVHNAMRWVSSESARQWAVQQQGCR